MPPDIPSDRTRPGLRMTDSAEAFDRITLDGLRAGGGLKWTAFPDCIGAFVAEMDFGTAPAVTAALRSAVDHAYHGYLPEALLRELGRACAEWHQARYGWTVPAEHVHAVPDVLQALEIVLRHFVPAGTPVLLPTPNYMPFLPLLRMLGNPAVQVPMRLAGARWEFDYEALDAAFAAGARLAILCNPHNPIGRVYARAELQRFAEIAERHGARVFADEIHAPLVYRGHRHVPYASVSEAAAAQAVTAVSASKAWNIPGLKCAQLLLTRPGDQQLWQRIGFLAGHGTATPGVLAHIAAYREGGAWLDQVLHYLEGNRELLGRLLRELLPEVGYVEPEGTYLAWLDCRPLQPRLPLPAHRLFHRDARVALTKGEDCGDAGAGHVRLNFAMPRPLLREAVERMARAVRAATAAG